MCLAGCGGTTITGNDIATETAWSSGGGGVSEYYKAPSWQVQCEMTGRTRQLNLAYLCVARQLAFSHDLRKTVVSSRNHVQIGKT